MTEAIKGLHDTSVEVEKSESSGNVRISVVENCTKATWSCFITPEQAERLASMLKRAALPAVL